MFTDRSHAHALLKPFLWFLVAIVALAVGTTLGDPWINEYGVKTAAKFACQTVIRNTRFGNKEPYEQEFVHRAASKGVALKPEQYSFMAEPYVREPSWLELKIEDIGLYQFPRPPPSVVCRAFITWRSETPWALVGGLVDIKPYKKLHKAEVEWVIKNSY